MLATALHGLDGRALVALALGAAVGYALASVRGLALRRDLERRLTAARQRRGVLVARLQHPRVRQRRQVAS